MRRKDRLALRNRQQQTRPDREVLLRSIADEAEGPEIEMGLSKGQPLTSGGALVHALTQRLETSSQDVNSMREEIHRLTNLLIDQARDVAENERERAQQWQYRLAVLLGMRPNVRR